MAPRNPPKAVAGRPDLIGWKVSLVGPGRVGSSFLSWLSRLGASIVTVSGRPGSSSEREATRLGLQLVPVEAVETGGEDLLLLTVPDRALAPVVNQLAARPQARIALHTAGTLGAEVLAPLRQRGSAVGTFHPLRAFARPARSLKAVRGYFVALGGDPAAIDCGFALAQALGAEPSVLDEAQRVPYHLAATLAAGGVATAWSAAWFAARQTGLPPAVVAGLRQLSRQAHRAALRAKIPISAITGPAPRGDLETLEKHLAWLAQEAPALRSLVLSLARTALKLQEQVAPLYPDQEQILRAVERHNLTGEHSGC